MQPLATIPPARLQDATASSELGARLGAAPLVPWPLSQGGAGVLAVVLLILGLIPAGIAVVLFLNGLPKAALGTGGVALPILLTAVGAFRKRGERRGSWAVHERGFTVDQNGRTLCAQWHDVQVVSLKEREWLVNGTPHGHLRELRLQVPGLTMILPHALKANEPDPFGDALGHLFRILGDQAQERIRSGGSLTGQGWALTQTGLRTPGGGSVAVSQLAAAGIFENRARLWVEGKDEPVIDLPEDSPNARLLLLLCARELPTRSGEAGAPPATGFGRRLFTKKSAGVALGWTALFFSGALLIIAGAVAVSDRPEWSFVGAMAVLAVVLAPVGWRFLGSRIFIHQRGVKTKGALSDRALLFSEVDGFTYSATRQYYNGAYTGTTHALTFRPAGKGKALSFTLHSRGSDQDIEALRDSVAAIVADRLHERLQAEGRVAWGPAHLGKEGVHYRPAKLFGGKQPEQLLPYTIAAHAFHEGNFLLFGEDQKKPVATLPCASANFFPGLQVYFRMCEEATRSARGGVEIVS